MGDAPLAVSDVRLWLIARQLRHFCNTVMFLGMSEPWDTLMAPVLLTQGRFAPELFPSVKHTRIHRRAPDLRVLTMLCSLSE